MVQRVTRETRRRGRELKLKIARGDLLFYYPFLDRDVTVTSTDVTTKSRHPSVRGLHGHHLVTQNQYVKQGMGGRRSVDEDASCIGLA